jgi:hypothetical protein
MTIKLSPSGKKLANTGPGAIGLTFRHHGDGQPFYIPSAAVSAISGVDGVVVDMQSNKLYDLELNVEAYARTLTTAASFATYYATRDTSTGVWGAWLPMIAGTHFLVGDQNYQSPGGAFTDSLFDVAVVASADRVRFGVQGDANTTAHVSLIPSLCWARILEYNP